MRPAHGSAALAIAAVFLLGLAAGATIGPLPASRRATANTTPAAPPPAVRPAENSALVRVAHPVQVMRVIDGDTFEARVNVWPGIDITTKVRLRGIDAPELRSRCDSEQAKARTAREALAAMLAEGAVGISRVSPDKYGGRVVADASTRRIADVSVALLRAGLVRSYGGGRRESWC